MSEVTRWIQFQEMKEARPSISVDVKRARCSIFRARLSSLRQMRQAGPGGHERGRGKDLEHGVEARRGEAVCGMYMYA